MVLQSLPPSFQYGLAAGSIAYFISRRLSPLLTESLGTKSFRQNVASLDSAKFYHYHSLLPSTIHALVQIIGTYNVVFYGRGGYDDDIDGTSSPAVVFDDRTIVPYGVTHLGPTVYMGIFVGYLLSDLSTAPSLSDMGYPFVLHHAAAAACWTIAAYNQVMQPVACLFQFNELSTPLMNIRQYLLTAGYTSSDLPVTVSGLAFFAAFGLVRVAPIPFVMRNWIMRDFAAVGKEVGTGGAVLFSIFFGVNALLQCGWFFIMCQKLVGMFSKKPKEKSQ
mmetsp:Transcript_395/g.776  ORF Transcript_395/g.776 Transcript_395/m.776 type:complete len:277 (-) Transcript_395:320-1150(-)